MAPTVHSTVYISEKLAKRRILFSKIFARIRKFELFALDLRRSGDWGSDSVLLSGAALCTEPESKSLNQPLTSPVSLFFLPYVEAGCVRINDQEKRRRQRLSRQFGGLGFDRFQTTFFSACTGTALQESTFVFGVVCVLVVNFAPEENVR